MDETLNSDEFLPFDLGRVEESGFDTDGFRGVGLDGQVVRWKQDGKAVEGVIRVGVVLGVVVQKA